MATPIKPNIGTKTDYASRPSVPSSQKENATEFNLLVSAIRANFERLILDWTTDVQANSTLDAGQYVLFTGVIYRIHTAYNVGNPITWDATKATAIGGGGGGDFWPLDNNATLLNTVVIDGDSSTHAIVFAAVLGFGVSGGLIEFTAPRIDLNNLATGLFLNGDEGDADQVLSSNGTSAAPTWKTIQQHFRGYYIDLAALQAAIPSGNDGDYAFIDAGIGTDAAIYIWDTDDNDWVQGGASATPAWSDTVAGSVERSTAGGSSESENIATQAAAGSATGLSASRAPSEVGLKDMLIKLFNTAVTWVAKMTFTVAPRYNSVTASNFLTVDSNKDLTSVAAATASEAITGTDNTKPLTALALEGKRSVKSQPISNSATGSTDIDCGSKQEFKAVYQTTVTGGITVTKSNDNNLEVLSLIIPVTGSNIAITFPSDVRMSQNWEVSSGDGWYQSTKIFQLSSANTADLHEFSLQRVGSIYLMTYEGAFRA